MARWRSGLTLQFAKLPFVGSTPTRTSKFKKSKNKKLSYFKGSFLFGEKSVDNLCGKQIFKLDKSRKTWTYLLFANFAISIYYLILA